MRKTSKRIIALLLAALMLAALMGCTKKSDDTGSGDTSTPSDTVTDTADTTGSGDAADGSQSYDDVYAMFKPDTVMITIGDYTVKWEELFFYLCTNVTSLKQGYEESYGAMPGWGELFDGEMTFADAVIRYSSDDAISRKVIEYGAKQLDVELSDSELAAMQSDYDVSVESYGGEEAFLELLKSSYIRSSDLYNYLVKISSLATLCFSSIYGYNGEALSDAEVIEQTVDDGYLMAKHILLLTSHEDETEMTDDEKAAVLEAAQALVAQLDAYEGDDFDAYFDELMLEHSKDLGGLQSYPEGYLFQQGDMVPEFFEGCLALEIGKYSEPIQTSYGYHIIYRLPINCDLIPYAHFRVQNYYSLRNLTAWELFESVANGWEDSLDVSFSAEYESLDIAKLFG